MGCFSADSIMERRKKETYAVLIKTNVYRYKAPNYDLFEFYVNGQRYLYKASQTHGFVVGEKYRLYYDSIDPARFKSLNLAEPLFLKEEKTGMTIGRLTYYKSKEFVIGYDYWINGEKHHRPQELPKAARDIKTIAKYAYYPVEYWMDNPQRAMIYYDQPIIEFDTSICIIGLSIPVPLTNTWYNEYKGIRSGDTVSGILFTKLPLMEGDKYYQITYKSKETEIPGYMLLFQPLFTPEEKTGLTVGEVFVKDKKARFVHYKYTVGEHVYEKDQYLMTKVKDIKALRHSRKFTVEYLLDNPMRAVLRLDEDVKK